MVPALGPAIPLPDSSSLAKLTKVHQMSIKMCLLKHFLIEKYYFNEMKGFTTECYLSEVLHNHRIQQFFTIEVNTLVLIHKCVQVKKQCVCIKTENSFVLKSKCKHTYMHRYAYFFLLKKKSQETVNYLQEKGINWSEV